MMKEEEEKERRSRPDENHTTSTLTVGKNIQYVPTQIQKCSKKSKKHVKQKSCDDITGLMDGIGFILFAYRCS